MSSYPGVSRGAYQKTIGRMSEVRRLRMALHLTQCELAMRVGVSERTVREHERSDWPSAKSVGRRVHRRLLDALERWLCLVETGKDGQA